MGRERLRIVEIADIARYLAVLRYGGVYADNDVRPAVPIAEWASRFGYTEPVDAILGDEFEVPTSGNPFQINQWVFYAAAPENPLFRKLADNIMDNIRSMPTTQNVEQTLARTGPVYFTKVIVDYLKSN